MDNPNQPNKDPILRKPDDVRTKNVMRNMGLWLLVPILLLLIFNFFQNGREVVEEIQYNPDFVSLVENKKIRKCEIVTELAGAQFIRGEMTEVDAKLGKPRKFKVEVVVTDGLPAWLKDNGVQFKFIRQRIDFWQILQGALPFLLVLGLLYFLVIRQIRSVGHGAMSFGKSRARLLARDHNKITFAEVAGVEEAREEVEEIVEFLKDPKKFQTLGGHMPKGVLLMGPPGTGKTLLAKAIAGEADVPFFSISGSDFVEMFVGVGASRVRDMFEQGKKSAPCIIFIDEIDAVGRSRFSGIGGGHDEREQTLNALLVEMDGFETQAGVIIIAATNRPDVLDPALLRPGRFDRQIIIDLPILEGREDILKIHAKKIVLSKDADLKRLARGTSGCSGADLANLINEAALLASRQGKKAVDMQDLEEARDKVRWGRERRSRVLDEETKRLTAYHESGHALVLQLVEKSEPLHKITIIPRGTAYLGATMQLPEKDRYTESLIKLKGILCGLMGGRAAEELVLGDITTGAGNDLKQATHLARLMVCNWGMSAILGPQTFGAQEELLFLGREVARNQDFSEETARRIDIEVAKLLREAYQKAMDILQQNRDKLDMIARLLLERETLDGRDIEEIAKHGRLLNDAEHTAAEGAPELDATENEQALPAAAPIK
ncbi:MAG: ATP-dependent zinc metalloprotease FtsH [Kiritimatiellae bacterium]|nr:ATP-dependent zinc metalloprotease FtsH [Kiritimatiellia bacterium]